MNVVFTASRTLEHSWTGRLRASLIGALSSRLMQTFEEADLAKDGRISHEEWLILVQKHPVIINYMTLPVLREVRVFTFSCEHPFEEGHIIPSLAHGVQQEQVVSIHKRLSSPLPLQSIYGRPSDASVMPGPAEFGSAVIEPGLLALLSYCMIRWLAPSLQ